MVGGFSQVRFVFLLVIFQQISCGFFHSAVVVDVELDVFVDEVCYSSYRFAVFVQAFVAAGTAVFVDYDADGVESH